MKKALLLGLLALGLASVGTVAANRHKSVEALADYDPAGADCFIYVVTGYGTDWSGRNIYGFGGDGSVKEFGDWVGSEVKTIATATKCANFGKDYDSYWNGGLYKIGYHSSSNMTHIIFNSGSGQTADIPLVNGSCYFYNGSTGYHQKDNLSKTAKAVFDFDDALGSVKTICSGSGAFAGMNDAQKCAIMAPLYSQYLSVINDGDAEAIGYLNDSKLTEGNHGLGWLATTVFKDVLDRNGYVFAANGAYDEPGAAKFIGTSVSNDSPAFIATIATISTVALASIGFTLFRKRKAE